MGLNKATLALVASAKAVSVIEETGAAGAAIQPLET